MIRKDFDIDESAKQAIEDLMNANGDPGVESTRKNLACIGAFLLNAHNEGTIPSELNHLFASMYGTIEIIQKLTFLAFTIEVNPPLIDWRDETKKLDKIEFLSELSAWFIGFQETLRDNFRDDKDDFND